MSDLMTEAIIGMPFDLAMCDTLSRIQFHKRAQSLLSDYKDIKLECKRLREALSDLLGCPANIV